MIEQKHIDRFMTKVKKTETCWNWLAGCFKDGYGAFSYADKRLGAHRFSYMAESKAEIPKGMLVLHRCDNPRCVNPEHLFLGTPRDNVHDMVAKGRHGYPGHKPVSR